MFMNLLVSRFKQYYSLGKGSKNKSGRPEDALAIKKYQSPTESLSDNFKSRDASASKNKDQNRILGLLPSMRRRRSTKRQQRDDVLASCPGCSGVMAASDKTNLLKVPSLLPSYSELCVSYTGCPRKKSLFLLRKIETKHDKQQKDAGGGRSGIFLICGFWSN